MPEKEEKNEVEQKQEQTDAWDKDRQKVDQLAANVSKLAGDKAELADQLSEMSEKSQAMQDTVARLEQQLSTAQVAKVESESLDPDMYDAQLMKKISGFDTEIANTKKLLAESNEQIKGLIEAKTRYEQEAENERETSRKAERKELILSDLDSEFGAKYRNDALKLAQEEVTQSGEAPDGEYAVQKLLRRHYKALSAAPGDTKSFSPVQVDTGDGSVVFKEGEIEEGSRDDVMASIRAKFKGKRFSMPEV